LALPDIVVDSIHKDNGILSGKRTVLRLKFSITIPWNVKVNVSHRRSHGFLAVAVSAVICVPRLIFFVLPFKKSLQINIYFNINLEGRHYFISTKLFTVGGADKKLDIGGALKGAIEDVFRNPEKTSIRFI